MVRFISTVKGFGRNHSDKRCLCYLLGSFSRTPYLLFSSVIGVRCSAILEQLLMV